MKFKNTLKDLLKTELWNVVVQKHNVAGVSLKGFFNMATLEGLKCFKLQDQQKLLIMIFQMCIYPGLNYSVWYAK